VGSSKKYLEIHQRVCHRLATFTSIHALTTQKPESQNIAQYGRSSLVWWIGAPNQDLLGHVTNLRHRSMTAGNLEECHIINVETAKLGINGVRSQASRSKRFSGICCSHLCSQILSYSRIVLSYDPCSPRLVVTVQNGLPRLFRTESVPTKSVPPAFSSNFRSRHSPPLLRPSMNALEVNSLADCDYHTRDL
jgi:hypothetical protein